MYEEEEGLCTRRENFCMRSEEDLCKRREEDLCDLCSQAGSLQLTGT